MHLRDHNRGGSWQAAGAAQELADEVQMAMRLASEIFEDADTDKSGSLDVQELSQIIVHLFEKMGKELPQDYQESVPHQDPRNE
jgi:hypothetical protein